MKKYLLSFALIIATVIPVAAGGDWHDDLISTMNSAKDVERTLAVDRNSSSGRIKHATYRYSFKSKSLYINLRDKLINHENEASNLILKSGENGSILAKFVKNGDYRNYSLSHENGKYHLIVAVNNSDAIAVEEASSTGTTSKNVKVVTANRNDADRKDIEQKQKEYAQKQREYAQKQREMALKQKELSEKQKELSQKQRELSQKQREIAKKNGNTYTFISTNTGSAVVTEEAEIAKELKKAENERKRLLNGD